MSAFRALPVVFAFAIATGGCTWNTKEKPVDVAADLPSVTFVIAAVQRAIDQTAVDPNWQGDSTFKQVKDNCDKDEALAKNTCVALKTNAVKECRRDKSGAADAICTDRLVTAAAKCEKASQTENCKYVEQMKPPAINNAMLQFTAARSAEVSGGASLKLISAELSRKLGRGSSYEIVLAPMPKPPGMRLMDTAEQPYDLQELTNAILSALSTAYPTCDPSTPCASLLGLKSAKYTFEITYEKKTSGGFEWSISPIKITEGKFGVSKESKLGNIITLELGR
ncbi:hypothetical protein [Lysobacter auxotrophicus]|uniref:Lipoprotein n=1 Tax=Lysobacter auxotrophicus TaxID=2992573 RepID=A0ABN6UEX6_9GAMM|nr:hypothetical protein [Lysobacter auxotrophicus]BDU14911.1 hypothetical protein LA521A_01120 [Lysobacter auxotrophicus]